MVNVDDLTCWILAHKKKKKQKTKKKKSQGIKENDYVTHLQYIFPHFRVLIGLRYYFFFFFF